MRKYTDSQKERLQVISERIKKIDDIILDQIVDRTKEIPLNLVLEARFLKLQKKGIELEAGIAYLEEQNEKSSINTIEVKKRRLDGVKGQLIELQNVGELLLNYHLFGRKFGIVEE